MSRAQTGENTFRYGRFDDTRDDAGNREFIKVSQPRPGTTLITMDHSERMNSMAFEQVTPLHAALEEVAHDNETGVVVLTGSGKGFCSGADTRHSAPPPNISGLTLTRIATRSMSILADLVPTMRRMPQPVIAAINGAAIGGGMCLSLGADVRIASESAYFRAAGINNGITAPELGLSFLLPRAIGSSRAFEIMLSGRDVPAAEAAEIGLVSRCVPDAQLLEAALDLADQINGWSTNGVQLTKRIMWAGLESGSLANAVELESHTQLYARLTTKNFEEAVLARKEGRSPFFED